MSIFKKPTSCTLAEILNSDEIGALKNVLSTIGEKRPDIFKELETKVNNNALLNKTDVFDLTQICMKWQSIDSMYGKMMVKLFKKSETMAE